MENTKTTDRSGYTLIEILVSVTLSLLLMLGVTQMFRGVGDTINDTQATINMAANLNSTAIILRNDLTAINPDLAYKASDLAKVPQGSRASTAGYLEIIEGQGAPNSVINANSIGSGIKYDKDSSAETHSEGKHIPPYWTAYSPDDKEGYGDRTVGDNDDILAFAVEEGIYNGLDTDDNTVITEENAEVIWFVRGTNLYRRVLLIKGHETPPPAGGGDISYGEGGVANALVPMPSSSINSIEDRKNRFGREIRDGSFPYPVKESWYYLRMPTLEEMLGNWSGSVDAPTLTRRGSISLSNFPAGTDWGTPSSDPPINQFWDFWNEPNGWNEVDPVTGSLTSLIEDPRNARAGEDIILTNVIAFDVKVWNPYWVPCSDGKWAPPQFVDLGQDRFYIDDDWRDVDYTADLTTTTDVPPYDDTDPNKTNVAGYGFTLKGRYNTVDAVRREDQNAGNPDKWHKADRIRNESDPSNTTYDSFGGSPMPCVFDSWSNEYLTDPSIAGLTNGQIADPPYAEPLRGIQVTIRCFDPRSGNIRQVRVTRFFEE